MTKHTYYPVELKIQIVERYLKGESAASLRKEFQIASSGTLYTWKKWYLEGDVSRLNSVFGRPLRHELSVSEELKQTKQELELLKKYFSQERW
ncbi:helix-turn-helix domain-containing protein [Listeria seeligeri]|uniref:helix-turn-helix domain-containing protein n=1 Tax=Listeria seeligeri TaxID=1640 RepID=UPI0016282E13|nr:helix-turn-helix domain-containing protein [Listeria seeligeri]MBC1886492.1 helix-turn-helix domain-containing protein [Listeria seeligeri]QPJ27541.1 helix-turn-helix domain-containing protein [Listeria seeligeri]